MLGAFDLTFAESGKLQSLVAEGRELLHRTDYRYDLGGGLSFAPSGWDECFPTIEAFGESGAMGDLVGREPEMITSIHGVAEIWRMPRYTAVRRFRRDGVSALKIEFTVENSSAAPIEFLWASHALFSSEDLHAVELPDGGVLRDFSLDGTSAKYFVENARPVRMRGGDFDCVLQTDQPYWGIWLNKGGWPAGRPAGFGCVGIEATNTAADAPRGAAIPPGGRFDGMVRLSVEPGEYIRL